MKQKYIANIGVAALMFLIFLNSTFAQKITVTQQSGRGSSLRGLCIVSDKIAWVSGSKGTVAITKDAGKTWQWQQVKGFEQSDFRDVQAFSDKEAVIMSSGTPALILKTMDGGASWQVKYHNRDTSVFFDAMDFNGKYGCVMGDPINGHFVIFETEDRGKTWKQRDPLKSPAGREGEACYAASGTCFSIYDNGLMKTDGLLIVSGGSAANLIYALISAKKWTATPLPIAHGTNSSGAFSFTSDSKHWVVVGGDYQHDQRTDSTVCYSNNAGKTWALAKISPGFQSCVQYISGKIYISTGTSGTNISKDAGLTWSKIDATSFNVCGHHGKFILFAGNGGKIGLYSEVKTK
jgi:photosystem II stability/assembly factor-like uncharacterized protein